MSTGPQGVQGPQGPMGPTGIAYTGSTGPQGAQGAQGPAYGPTGLTGPTGPAGSTLSSSSITIATYATGTIANTVAASNATVTYVSQTAIPAAAKGRTGLLMAYFDMQTTGAPFVSNTAFDYYLAIDGSNLGYGPVQKARYVQTATSSYNMIGSNGFVIGTGGLSPLFPAIIPVAISSGASMFQIGIANSTSAFGLATGVAASTGANTIVASAASTYTVPTTVGGSNVVGVYMYLWGGVGCGGQNNSYVGGAGGFVSGYYACSPGTVLSIVGSVQYGNSTTNGSSFGGGNFVCGGYSGVFLTTTAASNAICMAGGGGSAPGFQGGTDIISGGYGGYPNGSPPWSITSNMASSNVLGATQTAGGLGYVAYGSAATGSSLKGGIVNSQAYGGAGWFGGGAGRYDQNISNSGGAGGGSGYIGNVNGATGGIGLTSGAAYSNGTQLLVVGPSNTAPGGTTNPFYPGGVLYGWGTNASGTPTPGYAVIVPAVGTYGPVSVGVDARLLVI